MSYREFLDAKSHLAGEHGFAPVFMPDFLFDFQKSLVEWATVKGRAAIFADCGLGKTPMQLVWSENVARHTGRPVLILTPLAVAHQTVREADKFGIEARRSVAGEVSSRIVVSNYERLHYFNPDDFAGVVCDESSALKHFSGARQRATTEFLRKVPYRLLCTATAAPNDYIELGTSSEALGELGYMDMLGMFFRNEQNTATDKGRKWGNAIKWRFKRHAELPFWRWVCSWARSVRRPSDIGFGDERFSLPELVTQETVVECEKPRDGYLFAMPAIGLDEQREELRLTLAERCAAVAERVNGTGRPAVVWCQLNAEGDELERIIPDAAQVSGADSDERKEELFEAFSSGNLRVLVTKPRIGAFGLNWQHCNHMTFFPSHSFEQYYQAVRRCWRFGQTRDVEVDIITTEGERAVMANLKRKADQADVMFDVIVREMNNAIRVRRSSAGTINTEVPAWL